MVYNNCTAAAAAAAAGDGVNVRQGVAYVVLVVGLVVVEFVRGRIICIRLSISWTQRRHCCTVRTLLCFLAPPVLDLPFC